MGGILWLIGIVIASAIIMYGMAVGQELIMLAGFILLPVIALSAIKIIAKTEDSAHHTH
jgi:hypothetical protein